MNARSQVFEVVLEPRQVEEAVLSLFHTVLFHRSYGKFNFQNDSSYVVGTLGFEDVDCTSIDHTYVKAYSPGLAATLRQEVNTFTSDLKAGVKSGQVSLEFYQKKRKWPFAPEDIPWEVWTVRTELVSFNNDGERRQWQEKVGEMLADKILYVAEVMNRQDYVPKIPGKADMDLIFDTSFPDIQPYLFKISHATAIPCGPSVGSTVKRLFKDTLAL